MADTNHTILDSDRMARILGALDDANALSECVHYLVDAFQGRQSDMGIALTATEHLTRLLCWQLDVAHRELVQGMGFGSFAADLAALSR
ncbi:MAG TPA: hypothetical protein VGN52_24240 [Burkholderiales bacterium]